MKKYNLFLDFDNTFIPSKLCYQFAIEKISNDLIGLPWDSKIDFHSEWDRVRKESQEKLPTHPAKRNRLLHFKWMLRDKLSAQKQARILLYLENQYFTYFFEALQNFVVEHKQFYYEVFQLLESIQSDTFFCFVTNENLRTQIQKYHNVPFPENLNIPLWTSEEAGAEKPSLAFFTSLTDFFETSLDLPTAILGDSMEDDVQAGIQFQWKSYFIREMIGDRSTLNTFKKDDGFYQEVSHLLTALEHYKQTR